MLVGIKGIAKRLARTQDCGTDETMHCQAGYRETVEAFADAIDVDEEDEKATFLDRGVFGYTP